MAYIPKDARWYLADLVLEHTVEGDPRNLVHVNVYLIEADSPDRAYEKATFLGRESEQVYTNTSGREVRVRFRGLRELNVIHDELTDGAELVFEESVAVPEGELAGWLRPRQLLAVFRDSDSRRDVPNYMPESVAMSLEEAGFSREDVEADREAGPHREGTVSLVLELVQSPTDDARALIEELDAELSGPYAPEQRHGLSIARIFQPGVLFFIAREGGRPVGCGGVALEDGFAEVKRMYVRPHARGRGVARALLTRLEEEAGARGASRLTLETGDAQHAAIRFYERAGFTRCAAFGAYVAMPPGSIERSVFFEKGIA